MKIILLLLLSICPIISYADNDPYRRMSQAEVDAKYGQQNTNTNSEDGWMTEAEVDAKYGQSSQSPAPKQLSQAEAIALGSSNPRTLGMTNQEMIILFGGFIYEVQHVLWTA